MLEEFDQGRRRCCYYPSLFFFFLNIRGFTRFSTIRSGQVRVLSVLFEHSCHVVVGIPVDTCYLRLNIK